MVKLKVQKIGNSTMITIPKSIKDEAKIKIGDHVYMDFKDGLVTIKPSPVKKKKNFADTGGSLSIPNFDFEQSMKWLKEGAYDR